MDKKITKTQLKPEKIRKQEPEKKADPLKATIDAATRQMITRSQDLNIETVFDRAQNMKPCSIGVQGICCKNCSMGPCRLPIPKSGINGEDDRKGLCGCNPQYHYGQKLYTDDRRRGGRAFGSWPVCG
jgi:hypothetical protein